MMKTSKKGFTLAEVLTTLMVIGVVAAMTIPTLINSTDDQQKKVAFKKAMSVLGQGAQLMVAKEVECEVADSADLATCMNNVIAGTLTSTEGADGNIASKNVIQTSDGMAYAFIYKGPTDKDYTRTLTDVCGGGSMFGSTEESWAGEGALCFVVVDINGLNKGSKKFPDGIAGAMASSTKVTDSLMEGSDQIPLLLTGEGVRPMYNAGNALVNAGYEYMYGSNAVPDTSTSGTGGTGSGTGGTGSGAATP